MTSIRLRLLVFTIATGLIVFTPGGARAGVEFLGSTYVDGKGRDASGLTTVLEDGSRADMLDGIGSGIAYTGHGERYVLLSDRGPSINNYPGSNAVNRSVSFPCRYQVFDISVTPRAAGGGYDVAARFVTTRLLTNEKGQNLIGLSSAFSGSDPTANLRFRPESIRVAPGGTVYVSDEYGPSVYHFDATGRRIGAFAVPAKFKVASPKAKSSAENASNTRGRVAGRGLEGLAITPDGTHLLGAMQSPLIQDGGDGTRYTRMILLDAAHPDAPAPREFLYKLDPDPHHPGENLAITGVSDVVAINDHQFLVDERDSAANVTKHAYVIDISAAQDVSGIDSLAALTRAKLEAIVPVAKSDRPLVDLIALAKGKLGDVPEGYLKGFPDKVEGLAFGPDLADGRRLLLVTNDDDFAPSCGRVGFPNYIMAFAIDPADLPGFQAQRFAGAGDKAVAR